MRLIMIDILMFGAGLITGTLIFCVVDVFVNWLNEREEAKNILDN